MDVSSRTSHWPHSARERLFRERQHVAATITELPFHGSCRQEYTNQDEGPVTNRLCDACKHIISIIGGLLTEAVAVGRMRTQRIAMDYTLFELQTSAWAGCHLCSLLEVSSLGYIRDGKLTALESELEKSHDSWLYLDIVPSRMEEAGCIASMAYVNAKVLNTSNRELKFIPVTDSDRRSQDQDSQLVYSISEATGHDSTFDIAAGWLKRCREEHDLCKPLRPAEPRVPRRLLRLGETTAKLVDNNTNLQYACLSHCWGSHTNMSRYLTGGGAYEEFEISSLPKTFRDAMEVTRRLGLTHIWIDCFCILQGSKEDWIEQSAVMAQIYANSTFTIAALASPNVEGGCFLKRNPLAIQPLRTDTLTVEPRIGDNLWRLEVDGSRAEPSPLHTRAWVVQERLASIRTIYYGARGVYWECRCMRASENHVKDMDDVTENTKTMLGKLQKAAEADEDDTDRDEVLEFFDRWQQLLQAYSVCSLTYFSDKLIALSGITKDVEKYSGKRYIQGLWRDDISTGLLWLCRSPLDAVHEETSQRVTDSAFPTWSWASMLGRITYYNPAGKVVWRPQISVVDDANEKCLQLTSWKRAVSLADVDRLALIDDGSKRGDLNEDYTWYPDDDFPEETSLEIVLIQRVLTTQEPFTGAVRCLVVTCVTDNQYSRIGMTTLRFNDRRDDPFPAGNPPAGGRDIILV